MHWFGEFLGGLIVDGVFEFIERVCAASWRLIVRACRWLGRCGRSRA